MRGFNMTYSFGAVILAAGEGKRMGLEIPKPLASVMGNRLIDFPISEVGDFFSKKKIKGPITVVTGHKRHLIEEYLTENYIKHNVLLNFAIQEKQLGTADAIKTYFKSCKEAKLTDYTLIICADTPLIRSSDLETLYDVVINEKLDGVAASFISDDPYGLGRIIRAKKGFHIIEEKDASNEIKKIKEVNSGLYLLKTSFILEHLHKVDCNNNALEFYLTDLFGDDLNVRPVLFNDSYKFWGVNTLFQLEQVIDKIRMEKIDKLRTSGVHFINSSNVFIDWHVTVQKNAVIYPNVTIEGKSEIEANAIIETGALIRDTIIKKGAVIKAYSYLENSIVRSKAIIGPYAHLRPGSDIGEESKIGNFVEIKKATIDKGAKISHLSYVGDAYIGSNSNIGCGFITCNYDGVNKHFSRIGNNCFIGSDSQTVAPVEIGDNCYIASGSTINRSIPDDSFAISRGRQVIKEGMARRFLKQKKKK